MISIVIPTWNGRHLLAPCLNSLQHQTDDQFDVIVVDNGSEDGTMEWLHQLNFWKERLRCIRLETNRGFAGGVNAGIQSASGEWIILMNNDTFADPHWIESLHRAACEYPDYAMFTSKVLIHTPPYRIDTIGDGFTIAGFGYKIGWMQLDDGRFETARRIFGASGCASLVRREVFERIGMFDEDFFAFAEDLDLSFRALLAGYKCMFVPAARIFHAVHATAAPEKTLFWYHRNIIWLLYKNLPGRLMMLYGFHIGFHHLLVGLRSFIQGWFRLYIRSLWAGITGLSKMHSRRRIIQNSRRVSISEIRQNLTGNWIRVHWELSSWRRKRSERSGSKQ